MNSYEPRAQWNSFHSYVLVTTGAIVGLGNVFQFPLLVAKYGGLFLLFYVLCELAISLPILFAELLIGRRGKQNPVGSISILALEADASPRWSRLGWLSFIIVFMTLCYYVVSAAFPVGYFVDSLKELSVHGNTSVPVVLDSYLQSDFFKLELCFLFFLVFAMSVVYRGINRGLETISCVTVPMYFLIFLALAIICARGNFMDSFNALFALHPDVSILTVFFAALTFAFLKFGVGMGTMIVYGSYLPYTVSLAKSTVVIVIIDALVSLLSYFIVYPLMLESHVDAFIQEVTNRNIIHIFTNISYGIVISALFFFAAILAAWTPIIAMMETAVITMIERLHFTRKKAVLLISGGILLFGSLQVFIITQLSDILLFDKFSLDNFIKNITMDVLAPISAFLVVIFIGWIVKRQVTLNELQFNPLIYTIWRFLIRYVAPICIILILVTVTILETLVF